MQEIEIDFDALDASYIPGMEFAFFNTLATIDPFQPLTITERNELMVTRYGASDGCGTCMSLNQVSSRIDNYWWPDDEVITIDRYFERP